MNTFNVRGKVLDKDNRIRSSITDYTDVVRIHVEVSSVDFGENLSDLNEIEFPSVIKFEFFRQKIFHFDNDLRKAKLIPVEDNAQRSRELDEQVQSWTVGLRENDIIEFKATHISELGILDIQPYMFYKNPAHYQPYVIVSEYQEGWGIPRFIENKDENEEMDLTNEHVGEKPSFRKRIIPFLKRLFIEIIWNSLVSAWKWIFSNPS